MIINGIGTGGLAQALFPELIKKGHTVKQLISRNYEKAKLLIKQIPGVKWSTEITPDFLSANIIWLAVPDALIPDIAYKLAQFDQPHHPLLIHSAGSVSLNDISVYGDNIGVIYPLQTFSPNRNIDWHTTPIFIETTAKSNDLIHLLANQLSTTVHLANTTNRLYIHCGAVFAANFTNFLINCADKIAANASYNHLIYLPILKEMLNKLESLSPMIAQTGPARRNDIHTINKHLTLLSNQPLLQEIYQLLSLRIQELYTPENNT